MARCGWWDLKVVHPLCASMIRWNWCEHKSNFSSISTLSPCSTLYMFYTLATLFCCKNAYFVSINAKDIKLWYIKTWRFWVATMIITKFKQLDLNTLLRIWEIACTCPHIYTWSLQWVIYCCEICKHCNWAGLLLNL